MAFRLFDDKTVLDWHADHMAGSKDWGDGPERTIAETILNGIVARAETYCWARFDYSEEDSELCRRYGRYVYPSRLPLDEVAEVRPYCSGAIGEPLDAADYIVEVETGSIILTAAAGFEKYKVVYSGGYNVYGSDTNPLPDDLAQAFLTQFYHEVRMRTIALPEGGGTIFNAKNSENTALWLPTVRAVLDSYRRVPIL